MAIAPFRFDVGKIRSTGSKYPWEPGYVESVREQLNDLQVIFRDVVKQIGNVAPGICMQAMKPTFEKAKYYCPVDTGALVASAYLEIRPFRGQPRVEMGFARGGVPHYAVIVHENLEMKHKPPTQAKFLERALDEDMYQIEALIDQYFHEFWKSGERR
jgi:hypothetical protein